MKARTALLNFFCLSLSCFCGFWTLGSYLCYGQTTADGLNNVLRDNIQTMTLTFTPQMVLPQPSIVQISVLSDNDQTPPDNQKGPSQEDLLGQSKDRSISQSTVRKEEAYFILDLLERTGLMSRSERFYSESRDKTEGTPPPPKDSKPLSSAIDRTPMPGVTLGLSVSDGDWYHYYEVQGLSSEEAMSLLQSLASGLSDPSRENLWQLSNKLKFLK